LIIKCTIVYLIVHLDEMKSYREIKHQFCLWNSRVRLFRWFDQQ
jgi:hypothetical protein